MEICSMEEKEGPEICNTMEWGKMTWTCKRHRVEFIPTVFVVGMQLYSQREQQALIHSSKQSKQRKKHFKMLVWPDFVGSLELHRALCLPCCPPAAWPQSSSPQSQGMATSTGLNHSWTPALCYHSQGKISYHHAHSSCGLFHKPLLSWEESRESSQWWSESKEQPC